jgi:transposase
MLRAHLDGVLVWTKLRVSNGALEGINNKVKVISHRAYGYRTTWTYIANIYHCRLSPKSSRTRRAGRV